MQPQRALKETVRSRKAPPIQAVDPNRLYELHHVDAFEWLASARMDSIEAVVT